MGEIDRDLRFANLETREAALEAGGRRLLGYSSVAGAQVASEGSLVTKAEVSGPLGRAIACSPEPRTHDCFRSSAGPNARVHLGDERFAASLTQLGRDGPRAVG
jgi:hypothetical protein